VRKNAVFIGILRENSCRGLEIPHPPVSAPNSTIGKSRSDRTPTPVDTNYDFRPRKRTGRQYTLLLPKNKETSPFTRGSPSRICRLGYSPHKYNFPVAGNLRSQPVYAKLPEPGSRIARFRWSIHFCNLKRRYREVQLVHAPADKFHQQQKQKLPANTLTNTSSL